MQNTKSSDFFMCELSGLNVRKKIRRGNLFDRGITCGDPREGELSSFAMHALHAEFFMPLLLFQNKVLGRKKA
jgi:hypothetical protein